MGSLGVVEFVSLDGVMQGFHDPGDTVGGFRHGGWGAPYASEEIHRVGVESQPATGAYLFGRRTYDHLAAFWPHQPSDDLMAAHLNDTPKFVATRTVDDFAWRNTRRLGGELADAVRALKTATDGYVTVLGSGALVQQLVAADLVDTFQLFVHPLVLGSGRGLFPNLEAPVRLRLEHVAPTSVGVVMLSYATQR